MQGKQRRPGRAVLNTAPAGRLKQSVIPQALREVVSIEPKRNDFACRNLLGHVRTLWRSSHLQRDIENGW